MFQRFIDRPVLSTVISIFIVILGVLGLVSLPITQYPDIEPPTVSVRANYTGANAKTVLNSVIIPLEEGINGVEGMDYITSTASNGGGASIQIIFKPGTNPDMAAVNVQNIVSRAQNSLPQEVVKSGVTVNKAGDNDIFMFALTSADKSYSPEFLQSYAEINLVPQLKRVNGVGNADAFGRNSYALRVWLKPDVMKNYGVSTNDIAEAFNDQNIEAAPGNVGADSDQSFQYSLSYTGKLKEVEEFENIVIRSENGNMLRLKDIANVELGSESYSVQMKIDNNNAVIVRVSQTAGSNATEIIKDVQIELDKIKANLPHGLKIKEIDNANDFLSASISKVISTLFEAFILVFIVVLVFLQDWRSTLIPAISVPVAIIGTFFFLQILGFSINLLTLFALILAIGIVVDDAIVVVEAVHAKMESGINDPKEATKSAMSEISTAIISITLVMASVFVPVSFISGTAGVFYKQFGLTLAIAIFLSAINALTLSPVLTALFLKKGDHNGHSNQKNPGIITNLKNGFNSGFDSLTNKYKSLLHKLAGFKLFAFIVAGVAGILLFFMMRSTPQEFVPGEDMGFLYGAVSLPIGTSLEKTKAASEKVYNAIKDVEGIQSIAVINGMGFITGAGMNSSDATFFIKLKPWDKRRGIFEIWPEIMEKGGSVLESNQQFFPAPALSFGGMGTEIQIQDRSGGDINKFYADVSKFLALLNEKPEIATATTGFNPNYPQYELEADVNKIKNSGLSVSNVLGTVQTYFGSAYVSNFNQFGKEYRIILQANPQYRKSISDLSNIYVRTVDGGMTPVSQFVTAKQILGPQSLSRFNLYTAMKVSIQPNAGVSSSTVIDLVNQIAKETLPNNYSFDYSGITREEVKNSGGQTAMIFALCIIFVYFLLAALYESYLLPFAVLITLPTGLAGVFIFVKLANLIGLPMSNNIYLQISMVMLIGLLAKNAILIVEYAVLKRQHGLSILEAAIEGATARLRPILMTSIAFIFGLIPLVLGVFSGGAGVMGNFTIGWGSIGGMLIGTLLGLIITPSLFVVFQTLQEKFSSNIHNDKQH